MAYLDDFSHLAYRIQGNDLHSYRTEANEPLCGFKAAA
jgi:hypothetical protein